MVKTKYLSLDLDEVVAEAEYFCTEYDAGGEAHRIVIEEIDRERFLNAWAKEWRRRAEEALQNESDYEP